MNCSMSDLTDLKNKSVDELKAVIKELQLALNEKQGKKGLAALLDPDNFMGTGQTQAEFLAQGMIEVWHRSFSNQNRQEKKRRLKYLVRLSAELEHIREQTNQSTGLAEGILEDVIEGDWKMVKVMAEHFTFEDEHPEMRDRYAPIYAKFTAICREACEDRPEVKSLH